MKYDEIVLKLKHISDTPLAEDGFRVYIDRHWPSGLSQEDAQLGLWLGDIAPSPRLRKWFNHDVDRWEDFLDRYFAELDENPEVVTQLFQKATSGTITLLFSGREYRFNQAAALKMYLEGDG